jgi:PAP2 superfamily
MMLRAVARRTHAGWQEAAALATLYCAYELLRGMRNIDIASASEHARQIVRFEQRLGIFSERAVQHFSEGIPQLAHLLAILYPTLHVAGTIGVLVWVYRSRSHAFPLLRTTLVLVTTFALVVYVLYPVAPPRLAIAGFVDTVSERGPLDLSSTLLGRFYNPVAAVPSLHLAYALLVGGTIAWLAHPLALRLAGVIYPFLSLFVIVATGNHFYFDAATGAGLALLAALVARVLTREDSPSERRDTEAEAAHAAYREIREASPGRSNLRQRLGSDRVSRLHACRPSARARRAPNTETRTPHAH